MGTWDQLSCLLASLGLLLGIGPRWQVHSSRRPLNNSFSHYPQIAHRKPRDQLSRIFDQTPIPSLAIAKLAFDHPKGVFHFGPNGPKLSTTPWEVQYVLTLQKGN